MENEKISTTTWITLGTILYLLFRIFFSPSEYGIFETEYGVEVNWFYRLCKNIGTDVISILSFIFILWFYSVMYKLITGKDLVEKEKKNTDKN